MRNNNQKIIKKISNRSLRNNRTRNIFAIIAIALTAMLFTTLFSVGIAFTQLMEEQVMREIGTKAHAGLKNVTLEEYETITQHQLVVDSGYSGILGIAKNKQLQKRQTEIRYSEPGIQKFHFAKLKEGNWPVEENEVVLDTIVLDMLGIPHVLGEQVKLDFDFMEDQIEETFILSGIAGGDKAAHASTAFVSEAYWNKITGGYTQEYLKEQYHSLGLGSGLLDGDIQFKNSTDIEETIRKVISESGYDPDKEIEYGVNWGYLSEKSGDMDIFSIMLLTVVFFVMMLSGYLIIYNIFHVSIIRDIRFYGQLKAIGTTRKQIKKLVRRQALLLSAAGIPIGLVLGFLVGKTMMPLFLGLWSGLEADGFQVQFHPYIFIFSTLFSLLTVLISCSKPGRIAGNISPVEAVKFEVSSVRKKKGKKSKKGASIPRMAFSNLLRNKKRSGIVILSLSLSLVLLTEVYTLSKSFSLDRYLDSMVVGDFLIGSTELFNLNAMPQGKMGLDEEFLEEASKQPGIENKRLLWHAREHSSHFFSESARKELTKLVDEGRVTGNNNEYLEEGLRRIQEENDPVADTRFAYDEGLLSRLTVLEGSIDIEKFRTGDYVLVLPFTDDRSLYHPGDKMNLRFHGEDDAMIYDEDENGYSHGLHWENEREKTYEVMAVVDIPYGMTERRFTVYGVGTILPVDEFIKQDEAAQIMSASFEVEEEKQEDFQKFLEDYTQMIDPDCDYESKESLKDEFHAMVGNITVIGVVLSLVIALIGIINFINTMMTSVITRKREFAMMQSIGMTSQQLRKMLILEGVSYVAVTAVVSVAAGSILSFSLIRSLGDVMAYFEFNFTLAPYITVMPVFLLLAILIPVLVYSNVQKQSLIERIKDTE